MHAEGAFKADVCLLLKFGPRSLPNARNMWEYYVIMNESIQSLRLPKETFQGPFDVQRVIRNNVPTEEFNKALVSKTVYRYIYNLNIAFHIDYSTGIRVR